MNYKEPVDVSIEYAHTYLGYHSWYSIDIDREIGAKIGKHVKEIIEDSGLSTSQLLLIDDYNSTNGNRDEYSTWYIEFLKSHGVKPTHLVWEADCVEPAKQLLDTIPYVTPGLKHIGKYEKDDKLYVLPNKGKKIKVRDGQKYQCPLLASVSEASQLGLLNVPNQALVPDTSYVGNRALVILPSQFVSVGFHGSVYMVPSTYLETEEKVKRILSAAFGENLPLYHLFFDLYGAPTKDQVVTSLSELGVINHVKVF